MHTETVWMSEDIYGAISILTADRKKELAYIQDSQDVEQMYIDCNVSREDRADMQGGWLLTTEMPADLYDAYTDEMERMKHEAT